MIREVTLGGRHICYELERKRVKNINLRIIPDGSIHVSASSRVPESAIRSFILSKEGFILRALDRFEKARENAPQPLEYVSGEKLAVLGESTELLVVVGTRNGVCRVGDTVVLTVTDTSDTELKARTLNDYLCELCRETVTELCRALHPSFSDCCTHFPALRFKHMKTRWGSCHPLKGILTFNYALVHASPRCIEYVVAHELTHFAHPDHSQDFYARLAELIPDYKECRAKLAALPCAAQRK